MKNQQSGFTLVEIAIVLVIIGLLLGGVLKGQELINSAKVKNLIGDFRTISTFVYGYQDKFRALPGDDANANNNLTGGVVATTHATGAASGATRDGRINGAWNAPALAANAGEESYLFWQHVRLGGFASGDPTVGSANYAYRNADGGNVGITGDPVFTGAGGWTGSFFVCSAGIQGRYARQIDTTIDDGNTQTGSVRVLGVAGTGGELATSGTFAALTSVNDSELYTVCVSY
ncbi:MAG: hypothetical protein QG672_594 [Pseudomonadota bacterium]|nr:hypothetical protein [Pseudomonadota bacterium]